MKKILLISSFLVAITATTVHAESGFSEARRAGVFFTSAIAGAVVPSPYWHDGGCGERSVARRAGGKSRRTGIGRS